MLITGLNDLKLAGCTKGGAVRSFLQNLKLFQRNLIFNEI